MDKEPFDTPSNVRAERGKVVAEGPDETCVEFTPAAAFETAQRLEQAALEAEGRKTWRKE